MTTKAKVKRTTGHRFIHGCMSGNRIDVEVSIPPLGQVRQFEVRWNRKPSKNDRGEQNIWLAYFAKTVSDLAGRRLTLRMGDETRKPEHVQ